MAEQLIKIDTETVAKQKTITETSGQRVLQTLKNSNLNLSYFVLYKSDLIGYYKSAKKVKQRSAEKWYDRTAGAIVAFVEKVLVEFDSAVEQQKNVVSRYLNDENQIMLNPDQKTQLRNDRIMYVLFHCATRITPADRMWWIFWVYQKDHHSDEVLGQLKLLSCPEFIRRLQLGGKKNAVDHAVVYVSWMAAAPALATGTCTTYTKENTSITHTILNGGDNYDVGVVAAAAAAAADAGASGDTGDNDGDNNGDDNEEAWEEEIPIDEQEDHNLDGLRRQQPPPTAAAATAAAAASIKKKIDVPRHTLAAVQKMDKATFGAYWFDLASHKKQTWLEDRALEKLYYAVAPSSTFQVHFKARPPPPAGGGDDDDESDEEAGEGKTMPMKAGGENK